MIRMESEQWSTDENIDFDVITVESDGKTLFIGVSWDKTLYTVTIMYNEIEEKSIIEAAELKDFKYVKTLIYTTYKEAEVAFDEFRKPMVAIDFIKSHQRKEKNN